MAALAFICPEEKGVTHNETTGFYEIGDWSIGEKTARSTSLVTLHTKQKSPSYASFAVVATVPATDGRWKFIARKIDYTVDGNTLKWGQEQAHF